uniref:Uncharacterized protein n=1 Tax=Arundo donax TaxID=35708 RepID=A0A0A9GYH3_ARUDO
MLHNSCSSIAPVDGKLIEVFTGLLVLLAPEHW